MAELAACLGPEARLHEIAFAVSDGRPLAKLYWETPGWTPPAAERLLGALGLPAAALGPCIPGLVAEAEARSALSGLAVLVDPRRGPLPSATLATQAPQRIRWRPEHEAARIAAWCAAEGWSAEPYLRLARALRAAGRATRTLHTVTVGPGRRTAAVYLRPDGWFATASRPRDDSPADLEREIVS